jgi:hypothetical protein
MSFHYVGGLRDRRPTIDTDDWTAHDVFYRYVIGKPVGADEFADDGRFGDYADYAIVLLYEDAADFVSRHQLGCFDGRSAGLNVHETLCH